MRILYLCDNFSDHNRRFLAKASEAGHEVWFCNILSEELPRNYLPTEARSIRTEFFEEVERSPTSVARLLPALRRILEQLKPDLLQAGPVQTAGYLAALANFHPMLLVSWGSDMLVDANLGCEWQQATETALHMADAFFCDCAAVERVAREYRYPAERILFRFPWGVEPALFSCKEPSVREKKAGQETPGFKLISTRSWEPVYRINVLLEAFESAVSQDEHLRLLLLGEGSQSDWVRNRVTRSRWKDSVQVAGLVGRRDLSAWYHTANVYVSCAMSDGTSVSMLEAMATGLPVIATDIPSNREWITPGENGWLAIPDSPQSFALAMLEAACTQEDRLLWMGEKNRKQVERRADWDGNFPQMLDVYERLTCKHPFDRSQL